MVKIMSSSFPLASADKHRVVLAVTLDDTLFTALYRAVEEFR
jgi:hypothetical protein